MKVIKRNYTGEPDKLILIELGQYCFPLVRISMLPVIPDVVVYGKDYNQGPIWRNAVNVSIAKLA